MAKRSMTNYCDHQGIEISTSMNCPCCKESRLEVALIMAEAWIRAEGEHCLSREEILEELNDAFHSEYPVRIANRRDKGIMFS